MGSPNNQLVIESELADHLEHHYYHEVEMLSGTYKEHNKYKNELSSNSAQHNSKVNDSGKEDKNALWILHNATLESFLIHSRCLIEFFHADEWNDKHKTKGVFDLSRITKDYVAQHYLENWAEIRKEVPLSTNISVERFNEISRQLTHFSRTRKHDHRWPHFEIFPDLMKLHEAFVGNLPQQFHPYLPKSARGTFL